VFEWDANNESHIGEHGVSPAEAEDVFADPRRRGLLAYNTRTSVGTQVHPSAGAIEGNEIMAKRRLIPVERKDIPEFKTEDDEHQFWSTHAPGPETLEEMRPDFDPELPSPSEFSERGAGGARSDRTQPVPIRFEADLLRRLRALAARKNIGYQTLLKQFLAERLYEEEKREGTVG
jgi:hypothetical protein